MKKYTLYQIDAFTKIQFKGNPAGVVLHADGLTEDQMQLIAREMNNSETAFLFSADDDTCDGVIRYFTPKTEVPTCGHATIAAMYAKAVDENLDSCILRIKTRIGVLPFEIINNNDDYEIFMTQGPIEISPPLMEEYQIQLLSALGITTTDLDDRCPIQIASTGHSKVMIGIKSTDVLNNLEPDLESLKNLSSKIGSNGFFVFTFDIDDDCLTTGRMFAPAIGIKEDPVTGNANGPLGAYLVQNKIISVDSDHFTFKGKQGEKMNRTGIVNVHVQIENKQPILVKISGEAVIIFKTTIEI